MPGKNHRGPRGDLLVRFAIWVLKTFLRSPPGRQLYTYSKDRYLPDSREWLETNIIRLILPRLPDDFNNYRVLQLSDFHFGTFINAELLGQAVETANELNPDLVVITGDFVTHTPNLFAQDLISILKGIRAIDGTVAILGNHDHWSDPLIVREILSLAGIQELRNSSIIIRRAQSTLYIAGIDDVMEDLHDLEIIQNIIPDNAAAILLAHEPDIADQAASLNRFDLQLSGHTHGGQVVLPRYGPLILPRLGRRYPSGLYQVNGMYLYTNRGLGTAELKIRYNCPAEITLFELQSPFAADVPGMNNYQTGVVFQE